MNDKEIKDEIQIEEIQETSETLENFNLQDAVIYSTILEKKFEN